MRWIEEEARRAASAVIDDRPRPERGQREPFERGGGRLHRRGVRVAEGAPDGRGGGRILRGGEAEPGRAVRGGQRPRTELPALRLPRRRGVPLPTERYARQGVRDGTVANGSRSSDGLFSDEAPLATLHRSVPRLPMSELVQTTFHPP